MESPQISLSRLRLAIYHGITWAEKDFIYMKAYFFLYIKECMTYVSKIKISRVRKVVVVEIEILISEFTLTWFR